MDDRSEVVFVNAVEQTGFANGIFNVSFSTARFTPTLDRDTGKEVSSVNPYISANLRMDLFCVQQLHGILTEVLAKQTKASPKPTSMDVN